MRPSALRVLLNTHGYLPCSSKLISNRQRCLTVLLVCAAEPFYNFLKSKKGGFITSDIKCVIVALPS